MWTEFVSPVPALVQSNTETQMWRENTHVSLQTLFYRLEASVLASRLKHKEKQCGKDHVRAKHKTHRRYQIWWVIWTEIHKAVRRTNHLDVTSDCKTINEPKLNELMLLINVSSVSAAEHGLFVVGRLCSVKHSRNFSSLWVCGREFLECSTSVIKICWSQIFLPTASGDTNTEKGQNPSQGFKDSFLSSFTHPKPVWFMSSGKHRIRC